MGKDLHEAGLGHPGLIGALALHSKGQVPLKDWASITLRLKRKTCISRASIRRLISTVYISTEVRAGALVLPDRDLDDGVMTAAAEYTLADKPTQAFWPNWPKEISRALLRNFVTIFSRSIPIFRCRSKRR